MATSTIQSCEEKMKLHQLKSNCAKEHMHPVLCLSGEHFIVFVSLRLRCLSVSVYAAFHLFSSPLNFKYRCLVSIHTQVQKFNSLKFYTRLLGNLCCSCNIFHVMHLKSRSVSISPYSNIYMQEGEKCISHDSSVFFES